MRNSWAKSIISYAILCSIFRRRLRPRKTLHRNDSFRPPFPLYKMKAQKRAEFTETRRWVMNSLKRSKGMKYVALAALAIALAGGLANAQDIEGKFNLPFTARWGGVVLTPGQYSFTYDAVTLGGISFITVRRGTRNLGMIMPCGLASESQSRGRSHLTATLTDGSYRITSLELSDQGIGLRFAIPKSEVLEASQTNRSARNVPVLRASK
jgi:hypothetical protein